MHFERQEVVVDQNFMVDVGAGRWVEEEEEILIR